MRVAYYSPLPPSRSGIADYSTLLLPALRERVDVVVAQPGKRAPAADVALYHVGNDPDAHGWIVDALWKRPGVVVMHEFVLHHLIAGITIGRGNGRGYLDAMERDLGVAGRLLGLGVLDNLLPLLWETQPERFPLAGVVLDHAQGVIVHSDYVAQNARAAGYNGRLWRIPHPAGRRSPSSRRRRVGRSADRLLRLPEHEQADPAAARGLRVAAAPPAGGEAIARRCGRRAVRRRPPPRAARATEGVERLDYVPEERMWSLMAACDVLVNLRYPTMGETSGSVIRALSLGKPLLVSDVGWFSELPDDAVLKVPVDELEVATLEAALGFAVDHGASLGAAARAYVEREHSLDRVADAYAVALETAAGADRVDDAVLWRIAEAAVEVGIDDAPRLARAAVDAGIVT